MDTLQQSSFSLKPSFTIDRCASKLPTTSLMPSSLQLQKNNIIAAQFSWRAQTNLIKKANAAESGGMTQKGQQVRLQRGMAAAQFSRSAFSNRSNMVMKVNADESGRMMLANANASYAAPLEPPSGSSFIIRPLAEILRDLNKKVPDQVLKDKRGSLHQKYIPWYQANRMLSFYAPGWCGEVRDITFSADGKFVTVIYRVTIRGSDGQAFREASGTIFTADSGTEDPTQQAEEMAFVRACARFGLGLYLHHGEEQ
eukprot:c11115_g1_i1 orf=81-845(+)